MDSSIGHPSRINGKLLDGVSQAPAPQREVVFRQVVLDALGRAPRQIAPGKLHRFATSNKRGDDAGWCKLFIDLRGGVFGCNRSGIRGSWQAERRMTRGERVELGRRIAEATARRERQQSVQWAQNGERIARLWAQCVPLVHVDPVALYIKHRGLGGAWPVPVCLRHHPALPYWHEGEMLGAFPAMVAPLTAPDGRVVALHRTYLTRDGRKADVHSVRKLTGACGPLAGASIPLFKPMKGALGIGEGIETALAAWLASSVPTVAAYCAGNLAAWRWPAGVRRIVVFADHDPAGIDSAERLRHRARAAGLYVNVIKPTEPGSDWLDAWTQRDAVLIEGTVA